MTARAGPQRRLTGTLTVALPPAEAYRLFTPRGERDWVPGWEPRFPGPSTDDTHPGTVFETGDDGRTVTWIVLDRDPGRRIRYARVTPRVSAGTVTVALAPAAVGTRVSVTYELTALDEPARTELDAFAAGFDAFLETWAAAIAASLTYR